MQRLICLWLTVVMVGGFCGITAHGADPPRVAASGDLEKLLEGKQAITVDAGGGVSLKLLADQESSMMQKLAVFEKNNRINELEGGRFTEYARIESGPTTYWIIGEYSGGAHCCGQYHFYSRSDEQHSLKYLGRTVGHNGGPNPIKKSLRYRDGQIYFQSLDDRFDYFHESHGGSMLVNVPRCFYHLTPTSLRLDNTPFKDVYLAEVAPVEQEISREAARRPGKPEAILKPEFGPGFESTFFSDNLGQLLIKRSILYLYAREDQKAWQTLEKDLRKYYRTTRYLDNLRTEILEKLSQLPY